MLKVKLVVKPYNWSPVHKQKQTLGLYHGFTDTISIKLLSFGKRIKYSKFIKLFCSTLNHEYVHHHLNKMGLDSNLEEKICESMEVY